MSQIKQLTSLFVTCVVTGLSAAALFGCQAQNPPLTGPQLEPGVRIDRVTDIATKDGLIVSFDPRVDILFIIDDSNSMKNHQTNLSQNIRKFVDGFAKDGTNIDFHIGFTVVHDKDRYGKIVPEVCAANTTTPGRLNWSQPGTLQPLSGISGSRRYVTNMDDFGNILSRNLDPEKNKTLVKPFVQPFIPDDKSKPEICAYGPMSEELFTPLLGALENQALLAATNSGFRRPGAFFVAILLSDAKDSSGLDEVEVYTRIKAAVGEGKRGRNNFRIFSVVFKPGDTLGKCTPDPIWTDEYKAKKMSYSNVVVGAYENPLANLARMTEDGSLPGDAQILSICSRDYGDTLAVYGAKIQEDVLRDIEVELTSRPQITDDPAKKLAVYLEGSTVPGKRIALSEGAQWDYNPVSVTITIYNKSKAHPNGVDWSQYPGAKVRPSWTPVDPTADTARPL